jgi:Secretion system C-terminal sorting domain
MKSMLCAILVILTVATLATADMEVLWEIFLDDPLRTTPEIHAAANGDFVYSNITLDDQLEIVRLSPDGEVVSRFLFGEDVISGVAVPAFGGGYVGGLTIQVTPEFRSAQLFRADEEGEVLWFNDLDEQYGFKNIIEAPNSNWVIHTAPRHDNYELIQDDDIVIVSPEGDVLHSFWIPENQFVPWLVYQTRMRKDGSFIAYGNIHGVESNSGFRLDFDQEGHFVIHDEMRGVFSRFCSTPASLGETALYSDHVGGYNYQTRAVKRTDAGPQWDRNLEPGTTGASFYDICPMRERGYMTIGRYQGYHVVKALYETSGLVQDQYSLGTSDNRIARINLALDGTFVLIDRDGAIENEPRIRRIRVNETYEPINIEIGIKNGPINLPAEGGEVSLRMVIGNDYDIDEIIVTTLMLRHGDEPGGDGMQLARQPFFLTANRPVWYDEGTIQIPAGFPEGRYTATVRASHIGDPIIATSRAIFHKRAPAGENTLSEPVTGEFFGEFSTDTKLLADLENQDTSAMPGYKLDAPYPNPFNAETRFSIALPQPSEVSVIVYDIQGRIVATLAHNETHAAGRHDFTLNGSELASGLYFVQATVPGKMNEIRKLVLVK